MSPSTTSYLLSQGVLGVVCLALAAVVVSLYKEVQRLHNEKDALQSLRIDDAKQTIEKITQPLSSISQAVNLLTDKILISKRSRRND